jgi:hypothetical protein
VGGPAAVGYQDEVAVHPDDASRVVASRYGMGREPLRDAGRVAVTYKASEAVLIGGAFR